MYIPEASGFDPDTNGHFDIFGGRYVPETLMPALLELNEAYEKIRFDETFWKDVHYYLKDYVGRPSPLYYAANISKELSAKIYFKREDLNHTGAHKVNNVIAQGLIAQRLGKKKVIAETGAGQHGVATATIAALLGLECDIFMGAKDVARQELNVFRMKLLGANVHSVENGSRTLKDAMNEALKQGWSISRVHEYTKIDKWFLHKLKNIVDCEQELIKELSKNSILRAKQLGFSDKQISSIRSLNEIGFREYRKKGSILWIILRKKHFITLHTDIRRNIIAFRCAHQRVKQQAIHCFHGAFLN